MYVEYFVPAQSATVLDHLRPRQRRPGPRLVDAQIAVRAGRTTSSSRATKSTSSIGRGTGDRRSIRICMARFPRAPRRTTTSRDSSRRRRRRRCRTDRRPRDTISGPAPA
jgi:hypothetical protein